MPAPLPPAVHRPVAPWDALGAAPAHQLLPAVQSGSRKRRRRRRRQRRRRRRVVCRSGDHRGRGERGRREGEAWWPASRRLPADGHPGHVLSRCGACAVVCGDRRLSGGGGRGRSCDSTAAGDESWSVGSRPRRRGGGAAPRWCSRPSRRSHAKGALEFEPGPAQGPPRGCDLRRGFQVKWGGVEQKFIAHNTAQPPHLLSPPIFFLWQCCRQYSVFFFVLQTFTHIDKRTDDVRTTRPQNIYFHHVNM